MEPLGRPQTDYVSSSFTITDEEDVHSMTGYRTAFQALLGDTRVDRGSELIGAKLQRFPSSAAPITFDAHLPDVLEIFSFLIPNSSIS